MYVESVVLRNFQCFGPERTVINFEADLTAFVGTNGTGKTAACTALLRLFGITAADRSVVMDDFHVPADELGDVESRQLTVEAVLVFPELDDDTIDGTDAVPEFFHRMAADDDGILKCRLILEAAWQADGTVDGNLETSYWVVRTLDETYAEEDRVPLPSAERARIQMIYVPPSRDGARQVTAFLRGRLWRAAQWSTELRDLVATSAGQISAQFHSEPATETIERALSSRWAELHGAGTHATPRFQPLEADVTQLLRSTELVFEPDRSGAGRAARMLSEGQRSLLHLALASATLDIEKQLADGSAGDSFDMTSAHLPVLTLLVIEEPENSLAPFYLSRIITQVLALCGDTHAQALLSSHSAGVLTRIRPTNIRYFRFDAEADTAVVRRITLPDNATDAGKYVREAVQAHPELYFATFVVLGEGDTEQLVISRIAQARGVDLDPSFVAMVPLGGRHTNHFWRLLNDLHIPHATLLDLDYGRANAGPARLRDAARRLADDDVDVFAGLEGYDNFDDLADTMTRRQISAVIAHLRRYGVFFSTALDLDMAMLASFPLAYKTLEPGQRGPNASDATEAVLGADRPPTAMTYWAPTESKDLEKRQSELQWYRYLFITGSKPSAHLRALSLLTEEQLRDQAPEPLTALIHFIEQKLGL
jgi:putative ATP-dependent endonuclease of OLD family